MVVIVQNQQQETRFTDLEWLDNSIEFALKFFTKVAEVVLLIGVGYAGYKLAHRGPSNDLLDQVWIVSQILALDLSAPGLFAMARQARENDQHERAEWAKCIAITLIVMSILSMVEGAAEYFLPDVPKDFITWASFIMMIARCGAAVGYSVFCRLHKAERSTQLSIQPVQTPVHPVQVEQIDELKAQIAELANSVSQVHLSMSTLVQSVQINEQSGQIYTETCTHVQAFRMKIDSVHTPVHVLNLLNQTVADCEQATNETAVEEQVNSDATQIDESVPEEDAPLVYPSVPGIAEDVVKQIIDLHLEGVAWSAVGTQLSKNYSRIVKPVRDAYTQANSDMDTDRQPVHINLYRQAVL